MKCYETKSHLQATMHNYNYASKSLFFEVILLITLFSENDTVINEEDLAYAYGKLSTLECGK